MQRRTGIAVICALAAVLLAFGLWQRDRLGAELRHLHSLLLDRSNTKPLPDSPSRCLARLLSESELRLASVPDYRNNRGCGYSDGLEVAELRGVRFTRPVLVNCAVAAQLDSWLARDLKPLAERSFGSPLAAVEQLGGYNCRTIAGKKRLSEHSFANAIDVTAIRLADGRRLQLEGNWQAADNAPDSQRKLADFWQRAARSACRRFHVVLTPAYNDAHADHFHLDLGPFRSCRL